MEKTNQLYGTIIIISLLVFQICAWITGHNGNITYWLSAVITGIAGAIFGFTLSKKTT